MMTGGHGCLRKGSSETLELVAFGELTPFAKCPMCALPTKIRSQPPSFRPGAMSATKYTAECVLLTSTRGVEREIYKKDKENDLVVRHYLHGCRR
jgi:hypothetical protein